MGSQPVRSPSRSLVSTRGFTLLEVLLVVSMITVLAGIMIPVYQNFQVKNDLDIAANSVASSFHRAKTLATASEGDSQWGVRVQSGSITVFRGTSYAGRNSAFDEIFTVPTTITPSGLGEVVFDRLTGTALSTGTVTLTALTGRVRTVAITAKGAVSY